MTQQTAPYVHLDALVDNGRSLDVFWSNQITHIQNQGFVAGAGNVDFVINDDVGSMLHFSAVSSFVNDTCSVAGFVTDISEYTGVISLPSSANG